MNLRGRSVRGRPEREDGGPRGQPHSPATLGARWAPGAENGKGRVQAAAPEPRGRAGLRAGPEGRAGSWVPQPRPLFPASRSPQGSA